MGVSFCFFFVYIYVGVCMYISLNFLTIISFILNYLVFVFIGNRFIIIFFIFLFLFKEHFLFGFSFSFLLYFFQL